MVADGYFLEQVITGDLRDKHGFHDLEESQQKKKKKASPQPSNSMLSSQQRN